jgi:tetratricopeptide (TPR) repeat protein
MSMRLFLVYFLILSYQLSAQTTTYQELGKRFVSVLQTGKVEELSNLHAVPEVYQVIASNQMKGKTDKEISDLVGISLEALKQRTEDLFKLLLDYSIKTTSLAYVSANVSNFPKLSPQFFLMKLLVKYENVTDTLFLEVFDLKGKWYLVDLSGGDDKLQTILDNKGVPGPLYYKRKAAFAQKNKNYTSAIKALSMALELKQDAELFYLRGYNYSLIKDFASAKQDLSKAIALDPKYAKAYLELGFVHIQQFEYKEAISFLQKNIDLDSTSYFGNYYLGEAYDKTSDTSKAAQFYLKSDRIGRYQSHNPVFALALMRSRVGNYAAAEPLYAQAESRSPSTFEIHYYRGFNFVSLGEYQMAIASLDKALHIKPNQPDALYERAYSKLSLERFDEALLDFNSLVQTSPEYKSPRLFIHIGNCYLKMNQKAKACESFKMALPSAPEEAQQYLTEFCQ